MCISSLRFAVNKLLYRRFVVTFALIVSCGGFTWSLSHSGPVNASLQDQYSANLAEQNQLRAQIQDTQGQERSLANELAVMDDQIRLNELQVESTNSQIAVTQDQLTGVAGSIGAVSEKLGRLDGSISKMQDVADARIKASYMKSRTPSFSLLVAADSFHSAMVNYQYIRDFQGQDAKILGQINDNRTVFRTEKVALTNLQNQKESLRQQLVAQQASIVETQNQLASTKQARSNLLAVTKSNEASYQRLLAQQQAELNNILSAMNGGGTGRVELGYVHRGDVIGYEGSTGCSTGSHLHFGYLPPHPYYGNGTQGFTNPAPLLANGTLGKPHVGYPGDITQPFGYNYVTGAYGAGGHNGIDMADGYGSAVIAARDGNAVLTHDGGCPNLGIGTRNGHGIIITHSDGSQTWYWHLSSP